jgi:hypothetical protein
VQSTAANSTLGSSLKCSAALVNSGLAFLQCPHPESIESRARFSTPPLLTRSVEDRQDVPLLLQETVEGFVGQVYHLRLLLRPGLLGWRRRRGLFGVPHELDDLGRFAQVYVEFVLPVGEVLDGGVPFHGESVGDARFFGGVHCRHHSRDLYQAALESGAARWCEAYPVGFQSRGGFFVLGFNLLAMSAPGGVKHHQQRRFFFHDRVEVGGSQVDDLAVHFRPFLFFYLDRFSWIFHERDDGLTFVIALVLVLHDAISIVMW